MGPAPWLLHRSDEALLNERPNVAGRIFELTTAVVTVAALGAVVAILWLVLPLRGRARY